MPPELAQVAEELATAARKLAEAAEARTDLRQGVSTELPDLGDLDARIAAFKTAAMHIAAEPRKGIASDQHD